MVAFGMGSALEFLGHATVICMFCFAFMIKRAAASASRLGVADNILGFYELSTTRLRFDLGALCVEHFTLFL